MISDENKIYEIFMTYVAPPKITDEDQLIMDVLHFVARNFAAYKLEQSIKTLQNLKESL
jgi:hypothetical protein